MPFDPNQPFEVLDDAAAPEQSGFDPSQPFEVLSTPSTESTQSTTRNTLNAAARGATSEGFYSGVEGVARLLSNARRTLLTPFVKYEEFANRRTDTASDRQARNEKLARKVSELGEEVPALRKIEQGSAWYADAVAGTRADLREALPVDPEFQESLFGQIVQGVGQAAGTLPTFVVPGAGGGMAIGQLYDQAYQDALQHGADADTAHAAGLANVPAAALEYAGDKLLLGRILKPLKGKVTIRQFLTRVGASALSEGATEGAQQLWQNLVARSIVGYDLDRKINEQFVNSILVGAATGGVVSGVGQAGSAALRPGERAPAAVPEEPPSVVRPPSSDSPSGFDPNQPFEVLFDAADQSALRDPQSAIDSPAPAAAVGAAPEPAAPPPESAPPPAPLAQSGVGEPPAAEPITLQSSPAASAATVEATPGFSKLSEVAPPPAGAAETLAPETQNPSPAAPTTGSQVIHPAEEAPTEPAEASSGESPVQQNVAGAEALSRRAFDLTSEAWKAKESSGTSRYIIRHQAGASVFAAQAHREAANAFRAIGNDTMATVHERLAASQEAQVEDAFDARFRRLPPGTQFAIQRPSEYLGAQLPGYVQVDFFDAVGENTRSASPEAIAAEGWDLPPGTTGLPTGTYQVDTAGTLQPVADLATFRRDASQQRAAERAALAAQHARWRAAVDKLAPGLMQRFRIEFGDPSALVESGHAKAERLTGWEEAAYLAKERIFHLFDRTLTTNPDDRTILNLVHEMGHAHWDTLSATEQERLVDRWEQETTKRTGPLYAASQLRPEVALGVEVDVREWYAERVAFANRAFARRRANEAFGYGNDPVQAAAAKLRALLRQLLEWVAKLHPERTIVADFRQFLDTPTRPAPRPAMVGDFEFAAAQRPSANPQFAIRIPQSAQRRAAGLRDWLKREFTSRGDLPKEVFEAQLQRRAKLAEVEKAMRFALKDFDRALHAVYGGYRALTSPQLAQLNDALGGKLPLTQLDPRLRAPLTAMRQHIDTVSRELVRSGAVSGNLVGTISSNLGFYLNRSYRKFDDPQWAEKVPAAVRNRAASFLRAELRDQMIEELADTQLAAARQQAGLPALPAGLARRQPQWQTIRTQLAANQTLQPKEEEVQGLVEYLLRKDVTAEGGRIAGPKVDGAKDLSVLQRRQDIPEEIRALFGEYEDPRVNYARSVAKSASLVMAHRFLGEVRAAGLRGGWLHTKPTASARGNFSVQLAAEGSRTLAPLNGLYTSPEIAAAFKQLEQGASDDTLFRAWRTLNGWIKTAKTVLNPVTQVRNHVANYGFLLANGYWHLPDGAKVLQALRTELTGATTGRAYVSRLARLGVIGESVAAGEVREALADAGAKLSGIEPWLESRLARAAKAPLRAAERVYQLNDEVFKIYAFENERRGWAAALPQATPEQLDRIAAERVRNTLPTYSLIPRFAQRLRRYNLTGSFLSFPAEILRTGYHTLAYIKQDLGSANPTIRAMGARRLAGVALASSLIPAVAMVGRALAGVDKDDDRDVRRFLPEWSRNSDLLYTTPLEGGRVRLVDLSYLDPWNYLRKPVSAFLRGEDWQGSLLGAAGEATAPFIGEGLLTKRIADVMRNRTEQGAPIWNPAAAPLDRGMAGLGHLVEGFEPGIVTQSRRLWRAMTGYVAPTGRKYNLEDELLATTTGARSLSFDATDAHGFAARRYAAAKQQAEQLYTSVKNGQGTTTPEELAAAREEMEAARRALFDEATADTAAALRLGVARADTLINLRDSGLGETESALVLTGRYLPYTDKPLAKWELIRRLRQQQRQPAE